MDEAQQEKREIIICVDENELAKVLLNPGEFKVIIECDIPEDAEMKGARYSFEHGGLLIRMAHDSFDVCPPGCVPFIYGARYEEIGEESLMAKFN